MGVITLKENLETFWLCIRITEGLGAIASAVIAWNQAQIQVIEPVVSASMPLLKSQWFYSNAKTSCDISAHWKIKNEGKDVLNASDISYKVVSVKDNSVAANKGKLVDTSVGILLENSDVI